MLDKGWQENTQPDRRDAIRRRTRRKALLVLNSGWSTQNIQILNLSAAGALIEFDGIGAFPDVFQIRFDDRKKWATRIWSRGLQAGVTFETD